VLDQIKGLICVALLFALLSRADGEDYAVRFKQLKEQKAAGAEIDSLLSQWRAQKPNGPDARITGANYYFNQSVGPIVSTKKQRKAIMR